MSGKEAATWRAIKKLPKLDSYIITAIEEGPHTQHNQPGPQQVTSALENFTESGNKCIKSNGLGLWDVFTENEIHSGYRNVPQSVNIGIACMRNRRIIQKPY